MTSQKLQNELDSKLAAIHHLRECYSSYEAAASDLADQYLQRVTDMQNAEFAAVWTKDVTVQRSATWNAALHGMN
jgi:hypothetical protein